MIYYKGTNEVKQKPVDKPCESGTESDDTSPLGCELDEF